MAAQMLSTATSFSAKSFTRSSQLEPPNLSPSAIKSDAIATLCSSHPLNRSFQFKPETSKSFARTWGFKCTRQPLLHPLRSRRGHQPVLMMLPTANPERASSGKLPKWSARAVKSFSMAECEARKMKYPTTGTEALLMGILTEGTSYASKFLWANGVTLFKVRDESVKLLGKSNPLFSSPERPPLTESAQKALDWAVDEKTKLGESGEVTTTHMLLGIWAEKGSTGQQILANLGIDDKKAKELAESIKEEVAVSSK